MMSVSAHLPQSQRSRADRCRERVGDIVGTDAESRGEGEDRGDDRKPGVLEQSKGD